MARAAPVPVMLDESRRDEDAIDRLAAGRAAPLAPLKLAKLGGLDRLMRAGRRVPASASRRTIAGSILWEHIA